MTSAAPSPTRPRRFGLRFSLRTLLLVMAAVAVYLGGRASVTYRYALAPSLAGKWSMTLPAGFVQPTTIQDLGEGRYHMRSGGVLSGVYEWRNGQLVVSEPTDERMVGLVWKWDGSTLTLVGEPKNTPTGSSYFGATLAPANAAPPNASP